MGFLEKWPQIQSFDHPLHVYSALAESDSMLPELTQSLIIRLHSNAESHSAFYSALSDFQDAFQRLISLD